jgi:hypothetical protein
VIGIERRWSDSIVRSAVSGGNPPENAEVDISLEPTMLWLAAPHRSGGAAAERDYAENNYSMDAVVSTRKWGGIQSDLPNARGMERVYGFGGGCEAGTVRHLSGTS